MYSFLFICLKIFEVNLSQRNRRFRRLFHRKIGKNRQNRKNIKKLHLFELHNFIKNETILANFHTLYTLKDQNSLEKNKSQKELFDSLKINK